MLKYTPCMRWSITLAVGLQLGTLASSAQTSDMAAVAAKPTASFVTVEPGVRLEVLDWGGTGRPIVFLAGAAMDAHEFDKFAPKFTVKYHVYAVTRKGNGQSSAPAPSGDNYDANRLGDDVLSACNVLGLKRPVLIGHSLAGQELSSIGSRLPQKVAGLIYLDAGYAYALYSPQLGDLGIDAKELQGQLKTLLAAGFQDRDQVIEDEATVASLDRAMKRYLTTTALMPPPPPHPPLPAIPLATMNGIEKYTKVNVPVLAIFADPHDFSFLKLDPARTAAIVADDLKTTSAQIEAFQAAIPQAQVVRIPNADHFVFNSNEQQVYEDIIGFLAKLPE